MSRVRRWPHAAVVPAVVAVLAWGAGCSGEIDDPPPTPSPPRAAPADPSGGTTPRTAPEPDLDLALSEPAEDSVYPDVGDPGVDALHYDLDLDWDARDRRLTGTATITLRATADDDHVRLDLAEPLRVESVEVDGEPSAYSRPGDHLVVETPVTADQRLELTVAYAGRARPVPAPTTRSDFTTVGWTVTDRGEVWTMQEPYGAHSWYPVNDHPSDKALYDVAVTAPAPWRGVSNGALLGTETADGRTTTRWHLDEPAASYLMTVAIGDYARSHGTTESGLRVDYWYPRGLPSALADLRVAADAVDWIEQRLGPYPFSTLGLVLTDSQSAMETQTMVTLGNNDYVRSEPVVVHELVHQWYGDQVSPADWRDLWLNEGMTMYLQGLWSDEHDGPALRETLAQWRGLDQQLRDDHGPPGAYDPARFGGSNVYYSPALMWHELRTELGDREFWTLAREWLAEHDNGSVTREELYAFWEERSGRELSAFFDAWIMGERTPPAGLLG